MRRKGSLRGPISRMPGRSAVMRRSFQTCSPARGGHGGDVAKVPELECASSSTSRCRFRSAHKLASTAFLASLPSLGQSGWKNSKTTHHRFRPTPKWFKSFRVFVASVDSLATLAARKQDLWSPGHDSASAGGLHIGRATPSQCRTHRWPATLRLGRETGWGQAGARRAAQVRRLPRGLHRT
jgi:hypothetical protein